MRFIYFVLEMEPLLYSADIPWSTHSYICVIDCSSLFVAHTFFFLALFYSSFFSITDLLDCQEERRVHN